LGLIVTELVSNSFEHAFPDGAGSIEVLMTGGQPGEDTTLIVSDNGIGFAEKDDTGRHGLGLVKRLMEEVKGLATLRSDHGTKWTLKFPVTVTPPGRSDHQAAQLNDVSRENP
jgi:two-component sensor histidine kinase